MNLAGSNVAFDTTTENYTVSVSGKCVLTCYVSEIRSFKVLWQKIDRTNLGGNQTNNEQLTLIAFDGVVYSNKDHYRVESDYVGSYNLIIDRVNEDDQGEYQCQINTEPRKTKRIFLTVQVPPRIIDFRPNPSLVSVQSGTSLTLLCRAEGTPLPRIRWRIRDTDTNQIDLLPPDNSNVWFIPSVSNQFPRTVECIADNGVLPASNRVFTINVEFAPIVMINNDLIQSQLYQNITLECAVSSRPLARIIWEKKGNLMAENQMSNIQINQTMIINRLNIQLTNEDDFGQYNCIAENVHGRKEAMVFLLKETIVSSTSTPVSTTRKFHRYTKNSSLRLNYTRKHFRTTTIRTTTTTTTTPISTTSYIYVERGIHISSLTYRLQTSTQLLQLMLFIIAVFRFAR
ncbi:unnamed protein product [Adineta ricciae]|uniref:Ig-like domain-containing protein n=1 Tax=Adineta ricciae TaxID=249248 RepID=A0A814Q5N5_ADIRI|nr:unnamed protein product [Adineta ricciae]